MTRNPEYGLTSDFSSVAARYDATRDLRKDRLLACYDRLVDLGQFPAKGVVLDAGCGTGQLSLCLAERGYDVRGIDISADMIERARSKVPPGLKAFYSVGDVRSLPADDGSVDALVVSKLFQHVEDWEIVCLEAIRVVRPGGRIVHIIERGAFSNSVRRYFSDLATERGFTRRFLGLDPHSSAGIASFMIAQRCRSIPVDTSDIRWKTHISYGEAIDRIQERLFAEFWYMPDHVHDEMVAETRAWIETQPNGRDTIEHLTPYVTAEVFQTPVG